MSTKSTLLLFLAVCLFSAIRVEALPAQILIIRHAEKKDAGDALSTKGKERVAAFVPFFTETPTLITYGTPAAIYVPSVPSGESTSYVMDTVAPLAEKLKTTVINKYDKGSYKKMVEEIKANTAYNGKTILICWHHDVISEIARAFSALQTPAHWPNDVYDRVWGITFSSTGKATFQNIPQRLLFGDSAK